MPSIYDLAGIGHAERQRRRWAGRWVSQGVANSGSGLRAHDLARLGILAVVIALAWLVGVQLVCAQMADTDILRYPEVGLISYLDGTAIRPFAYRVLTPWIIHAALALHLQRLAVPDLDAAVLAACAKFPAASGGYEQIKAYVLVAAVAATLFLVATYAVALRIFGRPLWGVVAFGLAAFVVNALLLQGYGQIYDFPVAFAATIMLLLALEQRDVWFSVGLVAACLLKESFFLYAAIFAAIGYGRRPTRDVLRNLVVQIAICTAVYGGERAMFAANGGAPVYHNFAGHLRYIMDNTTLAALAAVAVPMLLVLYRLPEQPPALRRAMWVLPLFLALYLFGGNPGEFRIVLDIFPVLLLPMVDSCRRLTGLACLDSHD